MSKKNKEYDQNIIDALKRLPKPLKTAKGKEVVFDVDKRDETIFQHIAAKEHHLRLSDISLIPNILLNPNSVTNDCKSKRYNNYIGKRSKTNEKKKHLKIVTKVKSNNKESIITIYTVR